MYNIIITYFLLLKLPHTHTVNFDRLHFKIYCFHGGITKTLELFYEPIQTVLLYVGIELKHKS